MIKEIEKLALKQNELVKQAYSVFLSTIEEIIATKTKDVNHISHMLDYMLGFCFDKQILQLYRKLCRYLWDIDKETTVFYIQAYREMWDEGSERFDPDK